MRVLKCGWKYIAAFFLTLSFLTAMLVLTALIPRSAIRENVRKSAQYLCEGELFGTIKEGVEGSKTDRYADSILLGIAYQYNNEQPLTSVMQSSYYYTSYQNENENLRDAVEQNYKPNRQYLRYWHGSNVIVRPLLCIFNIQQIYVVNAIVLAGLIIALLFLLLKYKAYAPAIGVAAGLIAVSVWYVPFSLEYTWTCLCMLLLSITGFELAVHRRWKWIGIFFLIGGMITNFVDFLTTETLTLLVPLLLILWTDRHMNPGREKKELILNAVKACVAWICGYAGMWLMKWCMASLVLEENVMPYVSGHVQERLGGNLGIGLLQYITGAIIRNVRCLFPLEYDFYGIVAGGIIILFMVYISYVYYKKNTDKSWILLCAVCGIIPYVRYIVLHNHSYLHFFFTYRAQMATVLALILIMEELVDGRWLVRAYARKRRP